MVDAWSGLGFWGVVSQETVIKEIKIRVEKSRPADTDTVAIFIIVKPHFMVNIGNYVVICGDMAFKTTIVLMPLQSA